MTNLPSTFTYVGSGAFQNTGMNNTINLSSIQYIGANAFNAAFDMLPSNTLSIKLNNVVVIGDNAFSNINFSNNKNLIKIENSAFENTSIATKIDLSKVISLTSIRNLDFKNLKVSNIDLPTSIKQLGTQIFQNLILKEIDLSQTKLISLLASTFEMNLN